MITIKLENIKFVELVIQELQEYFNIQVSAIFSPKKLKFSETGNMFALWDGLGLTKTKYVSR